MAGLAGKACHASPSKELLFIPPQQDSLLIEPSHSVKARSASSLYWSR
jgi:hypothetical protein